MSVSSSVPVSPESPRQWTLIDAKFGSVREKISIHAFDPLQQAFALCFLPSLSPARAAATALLDGGPIRSGRRENLMLDEVEEELETWKLRGYHGG